MHRELLGVEKAIVAEAILLAGRSVLILSDAVGAVAYINKGGGCSDVMTAIMKRLLKVCVQHEICIRAEHLRVTTMKDAGVDSLSRWGEFEVRNDVSQSMQRSSRWGKAAGARGYTVDLYASPLAKQCTRYYTRGAEAESAGGEPSCLGDARLVKLTNDDNVWACPPLSDSGPDRSAQLHRNVSEGHHCGA